jgi:eukaryotic-like serine/threonine-protein kinase
MEAASRLRHERCVRALDFGEDAGHVYIAYEVVHGQTLRERLRNGSLDDRDAVEAAAQVLEALAHAHRRGIVHRDVKPSNIVVEEGPTVSVKLLDFGLAQFDEADTLTAVGDVPGTLAYIAPERLSGQEASARSDVWAVGVMLWESLTGAHPFWGVPLPQVATAIGEGAPPLATKRGDLPRRLLAAADAALALDPSRRPTAAQLAHELREAFTVTARSRADHRPRSRRRTPVARVSAEQAVPVAAAPVALEARLVPAGLAAVAALVGASILPFWPPGLVVAIALAAGLTTLRAPRLGLGIALAAPLFPLGNIAQAAALVYAALALVWLALVWRDPRAGLAFCAGPLLAPLGLIGLLPLAVQPARGAWRRALHAFTGVLAAAALAGLAGRELPLTGTIVGDLGVTGSEDPQAVGHALVGVMRDGVPLLTTGLALALAAVALPAAVRRGPRTIVALGIAQAALILAWAPTVPWPGIVLSSALATGLLLARPATVALARWQGR